MHLLNTLLLLGALALTAWFSRAAVQVSERRSQLVMAALPIAALVSVTGAIAALGDTLFPATSLAQGFHQDFSGAANLLLRLRVLHPAFAILGGLLFCRDLRHYSPFQKTERSGNKIISAVLVLALAQLSAGAINVILLAPVGMQITHLLMADLVWIALVLLAVEARPQALAAKLH